MTSYRQFASKTRALCSSMFLLLSNSGRRRPFIIISPPALYVPANVFICSLLARAMGFTPGESMFLCIMVLVPPESNKTRRSCLDLWSWILSATMIVVAISYFEQLSFGVGILYLISSNASIFSRPGSRAPLILENLGRPFYWALSKKGTNKIKNQTTLKKRIITNVQ